MGSVPFKSRQDKLIKRLNHQQRQFIYDKWKYEIENSDLIQSSITFDNMNEEQTSTGSNTKSRL